MDILDRGATLKAIRMPTRAGEGAAFGAAMQALDLIDEANDIQQLTKLHLKHDEERCCAPNASAVSFYNDSYQEYQRAVTTVATLYS